MLRLNEISGTTNTTVEISVLVGIGIIGVIVAGPA